MKLKIQEVSFHRNGICGHGFCAVRFRWTPDNAKDEESFLAFLFDEPGQCAVIGLDRIETMGVAFAQGNSWRGDHFEADLRKAVDEVAHTGGIHVGPFCVPV